MKEAWLRLAARLWGALPGERWRTSLLRATGPSFLVSVWALVLDERGRVLLFEHTHDRHHPWGLPSGRLEAQETPEHALEREFHEEVGGVLRPGPIVAALRDFPLPALRLVYRCELIVPPTRGSAEVVGWSFVEASQLPPGLRPLQQLVINRTCSGKPEPLSSAGLHR